MKYAGVPAKLPRFLMVPEDKLRRWIMKGMSPPPRDFIADLKALGRGLRRLARDLGKEIDV